ncbi:hypothetical protein ACI789_21365 [Geodermatophilus sp. SYSU D00965]
MIPTAAMKQDQKPALPPRPRALRKYTGVPRNERRVAHQGARAVPEPKENGTRRVPDRLRTMTVGVMVEAMATASAGNHNAVITT